MLLICLISCIPIKTLLKTSIMITHCFKEREEIGKAERVIGLSWNAGPAIFDVRSNTPHSLITKRIC